jgi:hypothetical protein
MMARLASHGLLVATYGTNEAFLGASIATRDTKRALWRDAPTIASGGPGRPGPWQVQDRCTQATRPVVSSPAQKTGARGQQPGVAPSPTSALPSCVVASSVRPHTQASATRHSRRLGHDLNTRKVIAVSHHCKRVGVFCAGARSGRMQDTRAPHPLTGVTYSLALSSLSAASQLGAMYAPGSCNLSFT